MKTRLLYLVSHPIQYQAPLLRRIAADENLALRVVFARDSGPGGSFDPGFRAVVKWDVPLREGYESRVLPGLGGPELQQEIAASDVIWMHGWEGVRMLRALGWARRHRIPVLMRGENTLAAMPDGRGSRGVLKRLLLKWVFVHCDAFLTIGRANRDYYLAHGVGPAQMFDMPYAVDNEFFRSRAAEAARRRDILRRELGLEPGRPIVLYAGKLIPRKHPLVLIDAFRSIDRTRSRNPYLLFVGDGPQRQAAEDVARPDTAIRFLGFRNQTELPPIYDLADVFVLAAAREPWGLAINEAMNCGCAVIASDQCGAAADLIDETCGAVVPPGDARALGGAIVDLLSDPVRLAARQHAARERVAGLNFDADLSGLRSAVAAVTETMRRA